MLEFFFFHHRSLFEAVGYWIAFFSIMIEGEGIIFLFFFLTSQGFFSIGRLFLVLLIGALIGDILWYYLGAWVNKNNFFKRLLKHAPIDLIGRNFLKRPFRTIFITKFTYGLYHITLMHIGALKYNFKKFIQYNFISNLVWIAAIGFLGYISGTGFSAVKRYLRFTEIGLLFTLIMFILVEYFIRRNSSEMEEEDDKYSSS